MGVFSVTRDESLRASIGVTPGGDELSQSAIVMHRRLGPAATAMVADNVYGGSIESDQHRQTGRKGEILQGAPRQEGDQGHAAVEGHSHLGAPWSDLGHGPCHKIGRMRR